MSRGIRPCSFRPAGDVGDLLLLFAEIAAVVDVALGLLELGVFPLGAGYEEGGVVWPEEGRSSFFSVLDNNDPVLQCTVQYC